MGRVGNSVAASSDTASFAFREGTDHLARAFERKLATLGHTNGKDVRLDNLYVPPQPEAIQTAVKAALPEVDLFVVWSAVASVENAKKVVAGRPSPSYFCR